MINHNQKNLLLNQVKFKNIIYIYILRVLINNLCQKQNLVKLTANFSLSYELKNKFKIIFYEIRAFLYF